VYQEASKQGPSWGNGSILPKSAQAGRPPLRHTVKIAGVLRVALVGQLKCNPGPVLLLHLCQVGPVSSVFHMMEQRLGEIEVFAQEMG
jgi:hypothetical protein